MMWSKQRHVPAKHQTPTIHIAVDDCGRQLARRLGWAAPAYHKKEDATPHPGAHKHGLQYDGRPDWHILVRVGTWNIGSLSGKGE